MNAVDNLPDNMQHVERMRPLLEDYRKRGRWWARDAIEAYLEILRAADKLQTALDAMDDYGRDMSDALGPGPDY